MSENLLLALQISGVGMSLVFGAIGLLWLVMVALVRVTADPPIKNVAEVAEPDVEAEALKQRAALAAVAAALALAEAAQPMPRFIPPPTSSVSAWQAVMRGRQLKQRGTTR